MSRHRSGSPRSSTTRFGRRRADRRRADARAAGRARSSRSTAAPRPLGAAPGAAPRQLVHRARRAARVPHPRRDQGRAGRDRPPDRRLRRPRRVRRALLRDGAHRRPADPARRCPRRGRPLPRRTAGRSSSSSTRSSRSTRSTGSACGLGDLAPTRRRTSPARSTGGCASSTPTTAATSRPRAGSRTGSTRTARRTSRCALCHGDYKLDNVLFAPESPPRLLAVVDWEMAAIGDPLVDLAWALIFHPGPEGTMPLGMAKEPTFAVEHLPDRARSWSSATPRRRAATSARIGWYDVFARWKLADRARGQLRQVPPGPVRQADPRVLRLAGRPAARQRDRARRHGGDGADAGMAGAGRGRAGRRAARGRARPRRSPAPGRSASASTAAGIGLPDVLMCRGTYPLTPPLPFTPGQEATGVVTAVGDGRRPRDRRPASCA